MRSNTARKCKQNGIMKTQLAVTMIAGSPQHTFFGNLAQDDKSTHDTTLSSAVDAWSCWCPEKFTAWANAVDTCLAAVR